MVRYYTNTPYWEEKNSRFAAENRDQAFQISADLRDKARQVTDDPARYHASQYLGHSCLVVVREAHPYTNDREAASLRDVLGIAIGPGASFYVEQHRTWKGTPEKWDAEGFERNKGGCTQFVREPNGLISELYLSDQPDPTAEDRRVRPTALGESEPYYGMRSTVDEALGAVEGQQTGDDCSHLYIVGADAIGPAGELMAVGHQFSHPALQQWQAEHLPMLQQAV